MKRILIIISGFGLGLGILLGSLGWWLWTRPCPVPQFAERIEGPGSSLLRIPTGMTLSSAADSLVASGLLANRSVFLLGARITSQERALRAGLFELDHGLSPRDLLEELTSGLAVQLRVTVPEGLGVAEVARILSDHLDFSEMEFLAVADSLARSEILRLGLLAGADSLQNENRFAILDSMFQLSGSDGTRRLHWCEGYLAPDTYLFSEGTSALSVARHLFQMQLIRLQTTHAILLSGDQDFSPHELLTLASLVESEARLEEERTLVAAVYTNRLNRNWRLEADPTVAFILEKKGKRLYYKDLKIKSPYNTYRQKGLPPGPIACPGPFSLQAAAGPDSNCAAMYFVSDGSGGHVFSRTVQEHEEAVRRFRKIRSSGGRR